ncbi:MAG: hypothetical protein ACR2PL_23525 [Dehalococcoidia bacterium]
MPRTMVRDAYAEYLALTDSSREDSLRTEDEIRAAILAAGLHYEQVKTSFWNHVRDEWFWGEHHRRPFRDRPEANKEYTRLANLRGLR